MTGLLGILGTADLLALGFFAAAWAAFTLVIDHLHSRFVCLSGLMAQRRREWMLALADREVRIVDTAILTGLQQGAAYFGTVAILAIGGCLAALGAADQAVTVFEDLPSLDPVSRSLIEVKLAGLTLIFVYSFFKFGWSYRLFNYCSILIGTVQQERDADAKTRRAQALRAGEMNILAGRHFNAGQRALFMALAYLGWFLGPAALCLSTAAVIAVLTRRQFFSSARRVALDDANP